MKAEENVASFLKQSEEVAVISTTPQDAYEDVEGTKQVCYSRKLFCQANVIVICLDSAGIAFGALRFQLAKSAVLFSNDDLGIFFKLSAPMSKTVTRIYNLL